MMNNRYNQLKDENENLQYKCIIQKIKNYNLLTMINNRYNQLKNENANLPHKCIIQEIKIPR